MSTGTRHQPDATPYESQIAEAIRERGDVDACIELWKTVIERAVIDLGYLKKHAGGGEPKKHERERLRRIRESPPNEFLASSWFETICEYIDIDPDRVRAGVDDHLRAA